MRITNIQWSDTAMVEIDGLLYSPFQMATWVARVTFDTGRAIIVVLPRGARLVQPNLYLWAIAIYRWTRDIIISDLPQPAFLLPEEHTP